jgi:type IV pilus assembly protein PilW
MMTRLVSPRRCAHGASLAELLIALALGLLVSATVVTLYRGQREVHQRIAGAGQMADAAAAALELIAMHVRIAGFAAARIEERSGDAAKGTAGEAQPALFGCAFGRVHGGPAMPVCKSDGAGSDGFQLRYEADVVSSWPTADGWPTNCLGQRVTERIALARFNAHVSSTTRTPSLYCETLSDAGLTTQPMVESIERLRVRYWLAGATSPIGAAALAADDWNRIVALDACVVVQGPRGRARSAYVDCDGVTVTTPDTRMRAAFTRSIGLRNAAVREVEPVAVPPERSR